MTTTTTVPSVPQWIGDEPEFRIPPAVPAEVVQAIEAFETAKRRSAVADANYITNRQRGDTTAAAAFLEDRLEQNDVIAHWWNWLDTRLPRETGWYPHRGRIYGFAKVDRCGLTLTRRNGWSAWPDEARAATYASVMARRAGDEARFEAFVNQHRSGAMA